MGGSITVAAPGFESMRAIYLLASDAKYIVPFGVAAIPLGPGPSGALNISICPVVVFRLP